ncbi:MAG: hypothetical protein BWY89_01185 [Bacteroidetes bacterium ADurb.BinA012]|nr:MAG: hypothetical protein BWY89_01185 [Bacteroidetes bacterium ADurb.BinA012]
MIINCRPAGLGNPVPVELRRTLLIEIDNHGILFRRVKVLRFVKEPLQRPPVKRGPLHHFRRSPQVILLLRIGICQPCLIPERKVSEQVVREKSEVLLRVDQAVSLPGFDRNAKGIISPCKPDRRILFANVKRIEAFCPGRFVYTNQILPFRRINIIILRIEVEKPVPDPLLPSVRSYIPGRGSCSRIK